jgi:hypothetical protein
MNKIVCILISAGAIAAISTTSATARTRIVAPSAIACENWANNYARHVSREGELLGGTALGSLAGFGIGSIFAASGVGAAIGAGIGIIGGIIVREQRIEQLYGAAYYDCMAGRTLVQPAMMRWY